MLKKLIATMAVLSLVTVNAAVPQQALTQAINEFNFAITVEWNQASTAGYNAALKKFKQEVLKLSTEGMTNEEIVSGVLANIKNKKIADEIKMMLKVVDVQQLTTSEAVDFIIDHVKSAPVEGASYAGGRRSNLIVAGLLVGLAIALIMILCDDDEEETPPQQETPPQEEPPQEEPPLEECEYDFQYEWEDPTYQEGCYDIV